MILEKVKEIIADELGFDIEKITLETNIQDDLGADSLDAVELIMSIEDEFDIMIPDDAAMEVKTVAQLVKLIEAETNKG
ncbi:MAG TPA: acyl carrier protein [Acholeplasma sp.]|jgi:acyl carrier protein|nr:acyl carrier protein [Acholeplasma sp.]